MSLVTFCALTGLSIIMNTWYKKRDMYKYNTLVVRNGIVLIIL